MAKRGFDSTDSLQWMNYAWPVCGTTNMSSGTTKVIALATIEATDIVLVTSVLATTAFLNAIAITAGTGFQCTFSATTDATITYLVFKRNQ